MKNSILKQINRLILTAKNGKKAYYEKTESALRLFIENFESELNHNVTPLKSIMDIMGKDCVYLREYLYKVSTIKYVGFSKDKNGNTKFTLKADKNGVKPNPEYFGKINWYDKPEKVKAEQALDDTAFIKALQNLINRFSKDSATVKIDYLTSLDKVLKKAVKASK